MQVERKKKPIPVSQNAMWHLGISCFVLTIIETPKIYSLQSENYRNQQIITMEKLKPENFDIKKGLMDYQYTYWRIFCGLINRVIAIAPKSTQRN